LAYDVRTQDNLAKWWITGTGSTVNRFSEVMDDMPDGPAIYHMDADNAWTAGAGSEWYVATSTKPDDVADNLAGWSKLTGTADDNMGSLNADEWTFDTGNNRVYVRLSDSSDPNATDMRKHYAWDGSGSGPNIMTETVEDEIYLIHLYLQVGDGSTATTLISTNEYVSFDSGVNFEIKVSATVTLGNPSGDYGDSGSFWYFRFTAQSLICWGGTLNVYASKLHYDGTAAAQFYQGNLTIKNSILSGNNSGSWANAFILNGAMTSSNFDTVTYCGLHGTGMWETPDTFNNVHIHNCTNGQGTATNTVTTNGVLVTTFTSDVSSNNNQIYNIDPKAGTTAPINVTANGEIHDQYTVNITVVDKDGTGIVGATVLCEGSDSGTASTEYDTQAFSVDTGASGVKLLQIIITLSSLFQNQVMKPL
jgi:hypothetical protein